MNQSIFNQTLDLLESTNLNWSVTKEPLFTADGKASETFGIYRGDTNDWLGSVGNKYTPMQNHTLAETIVMASQGIQCKTHRGGSLDGGSKVYIQCELPDEYIGNSGVKRWISALNSHDGSSSIGFGSTSQVVVCQNTFHKALKEVARFRHTASAEERVRLASEDLNKALLSDNILMTEFKRMADLKIGEEVIERVIRRIFTLDAKQTQSSEVSTLKKNQVTAFADSLQTEINTHGQTLWALFNGVTRYTNHHASPKDAEAKQTYLMVGGGYKNNLLGYEECIKWLGENTKQMYSMA
jgi:phage/plasmid-like protein (TIGR03299 family)